MTINKIIDLVDAQKPNAYEEKTKIAWLDKLDRTAFQEIISTHEEGDESFEGYDEDTDGETELLIPDEYQNVYLYWMYAMIDFANQEIQRYTNSMIMFNNEYAQFGNWYNRTHMPKQTWIKGAGGRIRR